MKLLNNYISRRLSAYKAGEVIQINILNQGLTNGDMQLIKNIFKNHPDEILKKFIEGLLGVSKRS